MPNPLSNAFVIMTLVAVGFFMVTLLAVSIQDFGTDLSRPD